MQDTVVGESYMSHCEKKKKEKEEKDNDIPPNDFKAFASLPPAPGLRTLNQLVLRLSNLDLQLAHRLHHRVIFPLHVRVRGLMQGHVEPPKEVCERKMELRVRQAVTCPRRDR